MLTIPDGVWNDSPRHSHYGPAEAASAISTLCDLNSLFNLVHRILHLWKMKLEPGGKQSSRHYPAALDNQLGFGPVKECCYLKHRARRRQSKGHATLPTDDPHHLTLRNWIRRGHVDRPTEIAVVNQPFDSPEEIFFVNP